MRMEALRMGNSTHPRLWQAIDRLFIKMLMPSFSLVPRAMHTAATVYEAEGRRIGLFGKTIWPIYLALCQKGYMGKLSCVKLIV
ncbi:hypothetical protein SB4_17430 [Sphingomonas sanguinis]|uniref:Uncharacterized protein n=1 Tax=Sphingomonas sanguinis TaxID=33051 RepID=A0A147IKH3_9SPHN|nr:hypothetical protein SB4_17430 [Sphingomonas sanguinis]